MGAIFASRPTKQDIPSDMETARTQWFRRIDRATWCALGGSLVLALVYCHLTVMHLSGGIAGGKYNGYENLWNDYWLRTALLHLHRNPLYTTYLDYPTGVSLRYHTLNPFGGLLALPLWSLVGPIASMNIKFILAIVGSTFFTYLLVRDLTDSPLAAFSGAVVYTYVNALMVQYYMTAEENYLMGAALLPLYAFFLLRAADRPRWWRDGVAATMTLFALCLTDWQYTLFASSSRSCIFSLPPGLIARYRRRSGCFAGSH